MWLVASAKSLIPRLVRNANSRLLHSAAILRTEKDRVDRDLQRFCRTNQLDHSLFLKSHPFYQIPKKGPFFDTKLSDLARRGPTATRKALSRSEQDEHRKT